MRKWLNMTAALVCGLGWQVSAHSQNSSAIGTVKIDPTQNLGRWDGWGSSLAWWGRAVGGTANADYYADLIYGGPNREALRAAVGNKPLWQSEYGESDASGYTMARSIVLDIRGLRPSAWVYWQPVEPDSKVYGWGWLNADYVDTQDQVRPGQSTSLIRVNLKFWVFGQFTRYIRPGYRIIGIEDSNSIAAYDPDSHKLIFVTVTGDTQQTVQFDLSAFKAVGETAQVVATTTAPENGIPDWKQHVEGVRLDGKGVRNLTLTLYPRSVYTFVIENVLS